MPLNRSHYSFHDKEERPWQNSRLTHGCIVGHTTTDSTKIWVRVRDEGEYTLVLSKFPLKDVRFENNGFISGDDDKDLDLIIESETIDYSTLLTHVFEIASKLDSDTKYYYGVLYKGDWVLGIQNNSHFRTLAASGKLTFGFYSCHMPFKKEGVLGGVRTSSSIENWSNLFEALSRYNADFVIGGGDQVYTDGHNKISIWAFLNKHKDEIIKLDELTQKELMLSWYDDIYRGFWGFNGIKRVFANFPNYMTWDDHEIRDGWGSFDEEELELVLRDGVLESAVERKENRELMYRMFDAACESYYYFQHSHNPTTNIDYVSVRDRQNILVRKWHYDFYAKKSAFFVMDTRGHKSMDKKDINYRRKITLLGDQQVSEFEAWLKKEETKKANVLFIVSAVPFIHWKQYVLEMAEVTNFGGGRDDVRDEWDHKLNHRERNLVLDMIFKFSHENDKKVFILSGDVHCAASFSLERHGYSASVFQLTSSAISYAKNFPSWLVKKQVEDFGILSGRDDVCFKRLTPVETVNNFATITVEEDDDDVKVHFDLYGRAEKQKGMLMYERLTL